VTKPPTWLRGSYPPLVTPFREGTVDEETFARLVAVQVREGSHGIVVNGTTAAPTTLTNEERARLVEIAVLEAAGRIPVVAATGSHSLSDTLWLTAQAESAGADAVLIVTPYFVRPPQRGIAEYFIEVGRRSALPLLLYHIPGRAAVGLEIETVERIAAAVPALAGIKVASNDLALVPQLRRRLGDALRIFAGLEDLSFPMLCLGASGLMNAVGNLAPKEIALLYEAVAASRLDEARARNERLSELNQAIFWDTNPIPLKYLMARMGLLRTDEHRLPLVPADPPLAARLDGVLERARLSPTPVAR